MGKQLKNPIFVERIELGHLKNIRVNAGQLYSNFPGRTWVTKSSGIRKNSKVKGYSITESLTAMRMKNLVEARNSFGFTNVWTQGGKILCKEDNRIKAFFD